MAIQSRIKQLGKDSVIYGVGGVLAKAVSFLLLPIYTRIFTPAEYGSIEMLTVICSLFSAVMMMGMDSAQSFYFFQTKKQGKSEQTKIVSAILQWKLFWGTLIVAVATLISPFINAWFFGGKLNWAHFTIAFGGTLFALVVRQSAEVYRLLYRPWSYILIILAQSVGSAVLILFLVLNLNKGILGYFLGTATASALICIPSWMLIREYVDFKKIHVEYWLKLIRFGAPLLPAGLAMYVMTTADRWFIQHYHDEEMLAFYAVGAKLAMLMAFAMETFRKAWWPIAMDAMHSKDGPETFRTIARLFMGIGVAGAVYMAFISPWLLKFMAAPIYSAVYPVLGILAWQSLFYGFYMIAAAGFWKTEKTKYIAFLAGGAALLNILLNIVLVPWLGGIGAAIGTSIAFLIWVVAAVLISEKLWYIGLPIQRMAIQILIGLCAACWILYAYKKQYPFTSIVLVSHVITLILFVSAFRSEKLQKLIRISGKS